MSVFIEAAKKLGWNVTQRGDATWIVEEENNSGFSDYKRQGGYDWHPQMKKLLMLAVLEKMGWGIECGDGKWQIFSSTGSRIKSTLESTTAWYEFSDLPEAVCAAFVEGK